MVDRYFPSSVNRLNALCPRDVHKSVTFILSRVSMQTPCAVLNCSSPSPAPPNLRMNSPDEEYWRMYCDPYPSATYISPLGAMAVSVGLYGISAVYTPIFLGSGTSIICFPLTVVLTTRPPLSAMKSTSSPPSSKMVNPWPAGNSWPQVVISFPDLS